jgi:chloramphenicol-sensitive protein RarD
MNRGLLYAFMAYFLWGVFPIYWKQIQYIPAIEIIAHRIVWAFIFVLLVVWIKKDWQNFFEAIKDAKVLLTFLITGLLLFVNWLVYIWAINTGFIVDTSLGYFINPLVSVVLGVIFLHERLRIGQLIPVGIATFGVIYLTVSYGSLPWIGLTLALSFGVYGLLKKTAPLSSIHGFTLEIGFLFIPAVIYLMFLSLDGQDAFLHGSTKDTFLLLFTGIATGLPLLLFGAAARLVPLSSLGFLQYIAPSLQFAIGVLIYGEAFTPERMIGFGSIWIALALYSVDNLRNRGNALANIHSK